MSRYFERLAARSAAVVAPRAVAAPAPLERHVEDEIAAPLSAPPPAMPVEAAPPTITPGAQPSHAQRGAQQIPAPKVEPHAPVVHPGPADVARDTTRDTTHATAPAVGTPRARPPAVAPASARIEAARPMAGPPLSAADPIDAVAPRIDAMPAGSEPKRNPNHVEPAVHADALLSTAPVMPSGSRVQAAAAQPARGPAQALPAPERTAAAATTSTAARAVAPAPAQVDVRIGQVTMTVHVPAPAPAPAAQTRRPAAPDFSPARYHLRASANQPWP